jgi:predicted MPP superfamily phosphohydrolase
MVPPKLEPVSRRQFMKKGLFFLTGLAAGIAAYSIFAERHWLDIRRINVSLKRLPKAFAGMRIVHFSDPHLGHYYEAKHLQRIAVLINQNRPDMICFTGDLVDRECSSLPDAAAVLAEMQAPLGKYAVLGNHDYRSGANQVAESLEQAGFQLLHNRHVRLQRGGEQLFIAGIDDALLGAPDLPQALYGIAKDQCTILLAHEPDVADEAARYPIDLQLSGHSHGGQVRFPFIGDLLTPRLGRKYPDGLQRVKNAGLQVYTNRGMGTTILPIRFLCRPELTVLTLS